MQQCYNNVAQVQCNDVYDFIFEMFGLIFLEFSRQWHKLTRISLRRSSIQKWKTCFWIPRDNQIQHGKSNKGVIQNITYGIFRKVNYIWQVLLFIYKSKWRLLTQCWCNEKQHDWKKRTLPREGLIPSIVLYICLASTTFEIISSK